MDPVIKLPPSLLIDPEITKNFFLATVTTVVMTIVIIYYIIKGTISFKTKKGWAVMLWLFTLYWTSYEGFERWPIPIVIMVTAGLILFLLPTRKNTINKT